MTSVKPFYALLPFMLMLTVLTGAAPAHAAPKASSTMPDGLMSALLTASSQPFVATAEGYRAHSGGLEVVLDTHGLHASADGLAWSLSLESWGRGEQSVSVAPAAIDQTDGRVEYRRAVLTEWYRDTVFGVEQGVTLQEAAPGGDPLVLRFELSTELAATVDADGRGLSFALPDGRTLRYAHLRAWDANNTPLDARLLYALGQIMLRVNDQGASYPITIDPLVYVEHKVTASGGAAGDSFGTSVALSGDTALVGAPDHDEGLNADQGAAYVFIHSGSGWIPQGKLLAADGAAGDVFGYSVAVSGDTALVGAFGAAINGKADQGAAYVFVRSGGIWTPQAKLTALDGAADDQFGGSVALSGETALVGARYHAVNSNTYQGAAYAFVRSGTTWTQQAELTASDGEAWDLFGSSVAVFGDTALVGARWDNVGGKNSQGSAYVFARSGTSWSQQAHLTASDGAASDNFGYSVALSGETALVGAYYDDVGTHTSQGSAYVFLRNGTSWSEQAHLTASDGAASDFFGISVALSGDTALVGAYYADVNAKPDQGAAYVFMRSGTTWTQQAKLLASDGATTDYFGVSVALSTDTALVGAYEANVGPNANQGAVYFYDSPNSRLYLPLLQRTAP